MTEAINIPDQMRSAQWTTVPIEASLKVNPATPLPPTARTLPKNSALVRISYASINPVDYKIPELGPARYTVMGSGPWIPACDYAGIVVTTNLPHVKPGDRVAGSMAGNSTISKYGALAEYAVIEGAENVAKLPDGVDLKDAASLGIAGQTAMQSIVPYIKEGTDSKVIINGASGGTGTFGIQIAKILGCTVTAICSGANVELCKSLGADKVIDYKSVDVIEELKKEGVQYDLLVDNVGMGGDIFTQSHHYLKEDGIYASIAGSPDLSTVIGMAKILALPTWLGGARRKGAFIARRAGKEEFVRMATWIKEGKLKPHIEKVYTLEEAGDAFKTLKSGRTRGKLVIKVSEE